MMLSTERVKVIHVTTHIGLIDAVDRIEPGLVERVIRRGHKALVDAGTPSPKIGVCGINPHAGENGLFGYGEEEEKIDPAVEVCRADGIDVARRRCRPTPCSSSPAAATTTSSSRCTTTRATARSRCSASRPGVNVTIGLPVIRTSVDHGTAFDIAGTGIADHRSMIEALRLGAEMAPTARRTPRVPSVAQAHRTDASGRDRPARHAPAGWPASRSSPTQLGVTASTIRRDLAKLTAQGKLARTYGGVMSLDHHPEASLRQRLGRGARRQARHRALGRRPRSSPARPCSSTPARRWAALADAITKDAASLTELDRRHGRHQHDGHARRQPRASTSSPLGGRLRPLSQAFVGPLAEAAVQRLSFDRAFMGADSVHAERGICEADLEQTRLKELMMSRADHTYVLAHADEARPVPLPRLGRHAAAVDPRHR